MRDLVGRRGAKVTGGSTDTELYETVEYGAASMTGSLTVIAAKPVNPGMDRYVVRVSE